jgi:hypothetical protein
MLREIRYAIRSLVRTPAWTLSLVLTIGLGMASNISVDGFVRGLLADGQRQAAEAGTALSSDAVAGTARIGRLLRISAIAVFAIACANVASFLLSRAAARSREAATRVAVGAGRRQLSQQILAESAVIALAGAAAGAILAMWIARIVPALLYDQDAEHMRLSADPAGVAVIVAVSIAIAMACGLLPLIEMRHDDPGAILQRENSGPSRASVRLGAGLVIVQMTACTLLVISTGLLWSGFESALRSSTSRRLSEPAVISLEVLQTSSKTQEMAAGLEYFAGAERAAREVAGAFAFTWVASVPGNRPSWRTFDIEGPAAPLREVTFERVPFVPRTLESIVVPPIEGRLFGTADAGACGGVVLSQAAARALGADRVAGRSIQTPSGWADIVGVVVPRDVPSAARVYHYAPAEQTGTAADSPPATAATYRVPQLTSSEPAMLDVNIVSPNYFEFMGLPVIAGRLFDDQIDACRVAVVNEEAATRYFAGHAVGGALIGRDGRRSAIIGVVRSAVLRTAQRVIEPMIYFPLEQNFIPRMSLIAETTGAGADVRRRLHRRVAAIPGGREDRIKVTTLDAHLSRTALAPERIATVLVGASAAIALVLGMLGLYGVMSDTARRRQREFALRIALGAQGGHVVGQVIREGLKLVIGGTLAGSAASVLVARWLTQVTPAGDALSPLIWLSAPAMLGLAVVIASVLPARRAASSDPLMIMRDS